MTNNMTAAPEMAAAAEPSITSMVGGILNDAQTLFKQELALVKREVTDEVTKAKEGAITLSIGISVAALGGLLLALMLVYLLQWASAERLPLWSCYGIVGAPLGILGAALFFWGKKKVDEIHLMPQLTLATMKDNVKWIKSQT
jgi:hypothetical protein